MKFKQIQQKSAILKCHTDQFALVDEIMKRCGMRFADVQQIKSKHIIDDTVVFFAGRKGGYDRYEPLPDLIPVLRAINKITPGECIFTLTYRQFYRWTTKNYPVMRKKGRKRNVVTHRHRNAYAKKLHKARHGDKASISRAVGHRTNRSIDHYITE
jgi:integrase